MQTFFEDSICQLISSLLDDLPMVLTNAEIDSLVTLIESARIERRHNPISKVKNFARVVWLSNSRSYRLETPLRTSSTEYNSTDLTN